MCGIGGIINSTRPYTSEDANSVFSKFLIQRGPDHFDFIEKENLYLTHSRLKVIDISDEANQPMSSYSGQSLIVFNGEIFNYKELRKLVGLNNAVNSDTRVLIEGIEKFGILEFLSKCVGMFAICYVDLNDRNVWLARDRFGQKPLYYSESEGLIFASDIRAVQSLLKSTSLSKNSISYFLSELSTPQPFTIWNEIKQVEPAQCIKFNFKGQRISEEKYWTLPTGKNTTLSEADTIIQAEELLQRAILERAHSDVPLGCFLSGGVDSGLIVSLLAQSSKQKIKTFSVGFEFDDFNELPDARIIAERYGTDHTEIRLDIQIENDIEKILAVSGEPFADSSIIPSYYISAEIKNQVTVALSGDGGDEMFGGYIDYVHAYLAEQFLKKNPNSLFRNFKTWWSKLGYRINKDLHNYGTENDFLKISPPFQLFRNMGFNPQSKNKYLPSNDFTKTYFLRQWDSEPSNSLTEQLMRASIKTRLLNDYLVKVDRASMAHGLEVRSPFLDHRLAEFAFSIPNEILFKNNESKFVLKKLGEKYMYPDIFNRKKRGFGIPIKHWLKNELYSFASDQISDLIKRKEYVSPLTADLLISHKAGKKDHTHRIWSLICLELWLKNNT